MKLLSISFNAVPRMPGLRPGEVSTIDVVKPNDAIRGWRLSIRGQQVFFISPPGWQRDHEKNRNRDPHGPITVFEVSRADVTFQWQGTPDELETILKSGKYDSPEPFGGLPPIAADKPLLAQVPPHQMGD